MQRSVILLNEKGVEYELSYIDLADKPDWFMQISPLGKVPVLLVDETPVFESAVIAEYLEETRERKLHPTDPLIKASHRAWIEFSSTLLMAQYRMSIAESEEQMAKEHSTVYQGLAQLSAQCDASGPFFAGEEMRLIDAAIAPLFMRIDLLKAKCDLDFYPNARIASWAEALADRESVKGSVVEDFASNYFKYFEKLGGYLFLSVI